MQAATTDTAPADLSAPCSLRKLQAATIAAARPHGADWLRGNILDPLGMEGVGSLSADQCRAAIALAESESATRKLRRDVIAMAGRKAMFAHVRRVAIDRGALWLRDNVLRKHGVDRLSALSDAALRAVAAAAVR